MSDFVNVGFSIAGFDRLGCPTGTLTGSFRVTFMPDYGDKSEDVFARAVRMARRECESPFQTITIRYDGKSVTLDTCK
jgi:hypothetical protein